MSTDDAPESDDDRDHDKWDHVDRLLGEAPEDVLYAASADLEDVARRLAAANDRALPFAVGDVDLGGFPCVEVRVGFWTEVEVRSGEQPRRGRLIRLGHRVVLAAKAKGVGPLGLLAYALVAIDDLGEDWRPRRIGDALPPGRRQLTDQLKVFRLTPAHDAVENALSKRLHVLLHGEHGSGRSALAANIALRRMDAGRAVVWLNLTDPADGPESVVRTLLQVERSEDYLLVADGLHANIPVVRAVLGCVRRLRSEFQLPLQALAIGLDTVVDLLHQGERVLDLTEVAIDGRDTIDMMLSELFDSGAYDPADRPSIEDLVDGDVHMASTAVEHYRRRDGTVPTELDMQLVYTGELDDPGERRALYHIACLGALGLVIARAEAEEAFGGCVARLHERGLIHRTDDAFTIGPRRRAELVMRYARDFWKDEGAERPEDIAWLHLQKSGGRAIRAMLSQLDRYVAHNKIRKRSLRLLSTWETLDRLAAALERKVDEDPTWGDNLGAAVFAAIALAQLRPDDHDRWERIARPVRRRWQYLDPASRLPEPLGGVTADFTDFTEIAQRMRLEDELLAPLAHPSGMQADEVIQDTAYRHWALGLLLGLEGTAPAQHREQRRIDALVAMARRAQSTDGSFYPKRVPWVTARVLIGLGQAGQRAKTSKVAWDASKWLIGLLGEGLGTARWRSGTGDWNSDEATTAMCLIGLYLARVPRREQTTRAAEWLGHHEEDWIRPDREIDLALALEALVLYPRAPIQDHLMTLLNRVQAELEAPRPPDNPRPEERLWVPFIASQLANLVWQTVRSECHALLRDVLNGPGEERAVPQPEAAPGDPQAVPPEADAESAGGLTPEQLRRWQDAAEQLGRTITESMNKRSGDAVSEVPSVRQAIQRLHERRERYYALTTQLTADAPLEVLREIDDLGRDVCKSAWARNLPFPGAAEAGG
ncbi:hypothetical protein [Dactylosporangium salmoneum]|uniref:ATP-binding protein n=1 Tax=Dactylosporangium salmoneum TaxID=53361 RepID=A0ABP5T2V6_9ACTN